MGAEEQEAVVDAEVVEEEEPNWWEQGVGLWIARIIAVLLLIVLLGASVYAVQDAITADRPAPEDPDFLDVIVASDSVVAAIRITIIAVAVFVLMSLAMLIYRRQWLVGFGPLRVAESVSDIDEEYEAALGLLQAAYQRIDELEDQLAATNELLDALLDGDEGAEEEGDTINDPEPEG